MANLGPLDQILNDTPANAVPVNTNFQTTQTFINTEVIHRDGAIAMTGPLQLTGNATQPNHAVSLAELGAAIPPALMADFGGTTAPSGWLLCDGSVVEQVDYPALYSELTSGANTGPGIWWDGSTPVGGTQFQLPDTRQRVTVGVGGVGSGWETVGARGGSADVPLLNHVHPLSAGGEHTHDLAHGHTASSGDQDTSHTHPIDHNHASATTSADGDHGHFYSARNNALASGDVGEAMISNSSGTGTTKATLNQPSHTHTLNLPNHTGNSGNQSASHAHTVPAHPATVTGSAGPANTDDAGEDPTGRNYSPYAVAAKMIKL